LSPAPLAGRMSAAAAVPPMLVDRYGQLATQLAEFAVAAAVLYGLGRLVAVPAFEWLLGRRDVEPTLAVAMVRIARTAVVVTALALAAGFAGFGALLGGSALLGAAATLAVGFAAQDVISNFVAGVFIVRDRNFSIGDWIEWDGRAGVIDDISFRVTRVRTFDNEVVTVPNTQLATDAVVNRTSSDALRLSCGFGVGYGDDLEAMTRLLLAVADDHPAVLAEPEPSVHVADLGDDGVALTARFWVEDPRLEAASNARSRFRRDALERCREAGIDLQNTSRHELTGDVAVQQ